MIVCSLRQSNADTTNRRRRSSPHFTSTRRRARPLKAFEPSVVSGVGALHGAAGYNDGARRDGGCGRGRRPLVVLGTCSRASLAA
jgi:hypothetical protein